MDEKNGEVFDHHAELFAQIGTISENDSIRDFMLNSGGMLEPSGTAKTIPVPVTHTGSTTQDNLWSHGYGCNDPTGLLLNNNRSGFNLPLSAPPLEMLSNEVENPSALLDNLVKSIPATESDLDQYTSPSLPNKNSNVDCRPAVPDNSNHMPGSLFGGLYRISSDKVTQDFLDNLNKLESSDMLIKCSEYENVSWNGLICDPISSMNFQSQNRLTHGLQSSFDKNGNSALFSSSHVDKISFGSNPSEHFTQNNFMARLSPSASVETCVRTPATSYESASPLSNNRTPIRSDESISPMGSGHTPLRVEDSTSPFPNIKTPLRIEEGSPMGRTPLRVEECFSPVGSGAGSFLTSNSPSHKANGQAQGSESYSPPGAFKKADPKSPTSCVHPSSCKLAETQGIADRKGEKQLIQTETHENVSEESAAAEKKEVLSASDAEGGKSSGAVESDRTSVETLLSQKGNKKILIPFVSAKRIDDPVVSKKSARRTLSKKVEGDFHAGSSSLSEKNESDLQSVEDDEDGNAKTDFLKVVPEAEKNKLSDAQKKARGGEEEEEEEEEEEAEEEEEQEEVVDRFGEELFERSTKKRRKKPENSCLPSSIKKRNRKRVTIYQSSMSPEESGIKLKIKLASGFQRAKPQKKRRSRKQYEGSDEEEEDFGGGSKKSKKAARFSAGGGSSSSSSIGIKESDSSEQTKWGNQIPPNILKRIFEFVVKEQGCVPSLVRFSSVCKLWNTVANCPELWQNIDLSSPYIKQKCKIDRYFRWLLENRLENIRELNLSGWKFSNITMVLSLIGTHCTDIESIGLAGWQGLHYEHLKSLLQDCPRLSKLDLSDVSPESKSANSAVSQKSITFLTHSMGERLTQLILAHNTLTCLPQIISSLATHCPNLQVLDLSNIRRVSHTEFALNIEHLQEGCQKLKVLRITNSCITLANVPLEKQVASPGFANLEELSIAGHQGTESLRITSVMDDSCLERILKTSHKLKLLDVRGCTRVTDSSLVRVPAWDIQHLFLSGCHVTRQCGSGLELIAQKWSHSLVEIDLAWTTVTDDLNAAVMAFAEKGSESPLRVMNLCGSSVTLEPVKALLSKCVNLESLNLQSCRGLPRGVKRLYEKDQLRELRIALERKDRDSNSEGEERRETEETKKDSPPFHSTNSSKKEDF